MKLELGKRYIRRDGSVTQPLIASRETGSPFYEPGAGLYFADGTFGFGDDCRNANFDIVAEYVEDEYEEIENLSLDAFIRIINALNGGVDAALDNCDYEEAIEYAIMMRECERMATPDTANE